MANALVRVQDIYGNQEGATLVLAIVATGSDVGSPQYGTTAVNLTGAEQPAAVRAAISAAVAAWPAENGYTFTIPTGNMNIPTFQKG